MPLEARQKAIQAAVPPAGNVVFHDVLLHFEGTPAPSHVLEATGGDVRWRLESGELALGDVYAGETRTEVMRVTVPAWVAGESFRVHGRGALRRRLARRRQARDQGRGAVRVRRPSGCIARNRHGDVIAYATALATLRKLDAAFVGDGVRAREGSACWRRSTRD